MQTFLPYPSFADSAAVLDRSRLGKQRVETMQIMSAIVSLRLPPDCPADPPVPVQYVSPWANHPAVRMWRGHEHSLLRYQIAVCAQWCGRGYRDTCLAKTEIILAHAKIRTDAGNPFWLGDPEFHRAHRSSLIRKLPEHYADLWPDEPRDLECVWPV